MMAAQQQVYRMPPLGGGRHDHPYHGMRRVTDPAGPAELRVHPGRDWSTVRSGAVVLRPGERTILVQAGETAQFSTMAPQVSGARPRG
jgi:hypothetical protein